MKTISIFIIIFGVTFGAPPEIGDRINLAYNIGTANAQNNQGASSSGAVALGSTTQLLYPNGDRRPVSSENWSGANAHHSGEAFPSTWADAGNNLNNQRTTGNEDAGYSGGKGNYFTQSRVQNMVIQSDLPGNPVVLSNLNPQAKTNKDKKSSSPPKSTKSTAPTAPNKTATKNQTTEDLISKESGNTLKNLGI